MPNHSDTAALTADGPSPASTQLPMLIGEVGLNSRSMWWNRSGRPRSDTSRGVPTATPAAATVTALRARRSLPAIRAATASGADAPAMPPTKKYQGTSIVQAGSLMTGRP
jgi:hypothetical protein